MWEDAEEFEKYAEETKALLGIDLTELVSLIKSSKCTWVSLQFEKGDYGIHLRFGSWLGIGHSNRLRIEFKSPRGTRKFQTQLS